MTVVVVASLAVLAIVLPKDQGRRIELEPTGTEPVQTVAAAEKEVPVTAARRAAVNATLAAFIRTAVTREDPAAAWPLVTRSMRAGVTRTQWNSGELPVVPYPARLPKTLEWNVITSYRDALLVDLLLQPRAGSKRGPIAFAVELKRARDGRWLIDSMAPEHVFAAPAAPSKPTPVNATPQYPKGRLSPLWFVIPGALLGLVVLVPIVLVLVSWWRNRAIERRYRAERGL